MDRISWATLKNFVDSRKLSIQWIDSNGNYYLKALDGIFGLECVLNKSQNLEEVADFEDNYKTNGNITPASQVVTLMEKDDKSLKLASKKAAFVDNIAVVSMQIPGELGTIGRFIAGGYGFTDIYYFGDRISKVEMIDKDFVYAGIPGFYPATPTEAGIEGVDGMSWADIMPDGVVLGSYHDTDVTEDEQGWYLWCDDGNQGGVDIDPLGGYGHLPSLAYLTITFKKESNSGATGAIVNIWWGKEE